MANDSFKVKKSLNIEPVASASPTAKGDIVYDSTSDTVKYYNGSSRTVVNTDEAQTLTNKTLTTPVISSISNTGTVTLPTSTDTLVGRGTTDTLTNKTLTAPAINGANLNFGTASNTNRLLLPSDTTSNLDALTDTAGLIAFDTTTGAPVFNNGSSWSSIGSGGGAFNYITSSNGSGTSASDFTAYADAAGSLPVDMTGGSPNADFTLATTTSSPLTGTNSLLLTHTANNRQGTGWAATYTTNVSDRGKVISFSMDYTIASGTYASGDLIFYAYDVTNSALIQPTPYSILTHSLTSDKFFAEFQVPYTCASLRIGFHVATSTATAYTMKLDNLVLSDSSYGKWYGSVATDWIEYTPTFTGFGTVSSVKSFYRRVGDSLELDVKWSNGTPTSTEARCSLPTGMTVDSSYTSLRLVGHGTRSVDAAAYSRNWNVLANGGLTYVNFAIGETNTVSASLAAANADVISGSTSVISFRALIKISGWSVSQLLSDSADTRVIALIATGSAASASSGNPIIFPTVTKDSHAAYNSSTGRYTAPISGWYQVSAGAAVTAGTAARLQIYVDASLYAIIGFVNSTDGLLVASGLCYVNAGQVIDLRPNATVAGMNANSSFCIQRVSGPAQIRASEKPFSEVRYSQSGSTTAGWGSTNTKIRIYTTSEKSTGSDITYASSSTAGSSFTINTTGCYEISFGDSAASGAMQIGISVNASSLTTSLNSLTYAQGKRAYSNPTGQYHGSTTLYLTAGDIVRGHGDATSAITTGNVYLHIKRIF